MSTEEMFDVLDEAGQKTGSVAGKREVHQRGLWHTGMHLCVTDGAGNVFQQLRGSAPDVRILPDVWDLFIAAGHVSAGEEVLTTLLRETEEEVGVKLSIAELRANGLEEVSVTRSDYWVDDPKFPEGGYHHRVFDHNFVVRLPDLDPDTLVLEDKKVLGVRKYPVQQLRLDLMQPAASKDYRQHAHRPIEDDRLYQTVLSGVSVLTS
jgi:8-oxo-dGTP pyrophosphatase MutT (NUDIX family)